MIIETDDDNFPRLGFFGKHNRAAAASVSEGAGWVNVYRHFSDANIWPRGLPLSEVSRAPSPFEDLPIATVDAPIQQGLADENPDVDAIYRLILLFPQNFPADRRLATGNGSWHPAQAVQTASSDRARRPPSAGPTQA